MSTIGKARAADIAYHKINAMKKQNIQTDVKESDSLMGNRMKKNINQTKEQDNDLLKIARIMSRIEEGFKRGINKNDKRTTKV